MKPTHENPEWDNPKPWQKNVDREQAVYDILRHMLDTRGYIPPLPEMAAMLGIKTHRLFMYYLRHLQARGLIVVRPGDRKNYIEVIGYMPLDRLDRVRKYARACLAMMLVEGKYDPDSDAYTRARALYKEAKAALRDGDL